MDRHYRPLAVMAGIVALVTAISFVPRLFQHPAPAAPPATTADAALKEFFERHDKNESLSDFLAGITAPPDLTPGTTAPPSVTADPFPVLGVTVEGYAAITDGMSWERVRHLLGSGGTEISDTTIGGFHTQLFEWRARNGGVLIVTFQRNEVVSKAQRGLP